LELNIADKCEWLQKLVENIHNFLQNEHFIKVTGIKLL